MALDRWPTRRWKYKDRKSSVPKILLILQISIGRDHGIERSFCRIQEITVRQLRPTHLERGCNRVVRQGVPQRGWRSLVEQNPHGGACNQSGDRETPLGMFQHRLCLLPGDSRKPLQEIIEPCARLQICEKCLHRHARPSEDPRPTDFFRSPLDGEALIPIEHPKRLADESIAGKLVKSTRRGRQVDIEEQTMKTCRGDVLAIANISPSMYSLFHSAARSMRRYSSGVNRTSSLVVMTDHR